MKSLIRSGDPSWCTSVAWRQACCKILTRPPLMSSVAWSDPVVDSALKCLSAALRYVSPLWIDIRILILTQMQALKIQPRSNVVKKEEDMSAEQLQYENAAASSNERLYGKSVILPQPHILQMLMHHKVRS